MNLTKELEQHLLKLPIEDKVKVMQMFADEFMTIEEYHQCSKMPIRTIYAKLGTDAVKGFEFCGHKIIYM